MAVDTAIFLPQDSLRASMAEQEKLKFRNVFEILPTLVSTVNTIWPSGVSIKDTVIVSIKYLIDSDGRVEMATVEKSSDVRFNKSALRAVIQSKFKWPQHYSREPIWLRVPYRFIGR
jgi:TonB family protein